MTRDKQILESIRNHAQLLHESSMKALECAESYAKRGPYTVKAKYNYEGRVEAYTKAAEVLESILAEWE